MTDIRSSNEEESPLSGTFGTSPRRRALVGVLPETESSPPAVERITYSDLRRLYGNRRVKEMTHDEKFLFFNRTQNEFRSIHDVKPNIQQA
jgi:hypothetical protein